ncbi:single hybrid motif-containing protein [Scleroderma yunnanense]
MRTASLGRFLLHRRWLHHTRARHAISNLEMPAMSPTMIEGGIASWKKKEGEAFSAGDVLLEIETDKATIDVEAQDDGVLAKIIAPGGTKNVPVGKIIALLSEEGDDISNLEVPTEEPKPSPIDNASASAASSPPSTPQQSEPAQEKAAAHHPTHSKPLLPSVMRLLVEHSVTNPEVINGTGVRGQLTKGDVLAYLGKASSPTGTYKETKKEAVVPQKSEPPKPLDAATIRQLIVSGLASRLKPTLSTSSTVPTFDSIIVDYLPHTTKTPSLTQLNPLVKHKDSTTAYFDGFL